MAPLFWPTLYTILKPNKVIGLIAQTSSVLSHKPTTEVSRGLCLQPLVSLVHLRTKFRSCFYLRLMINLLAFSALTQEGHPACKKLSGGVLERSADLHMAQLMPFPLTVSCFSKIQIGFTFLVPPHPGSPGQRAVKRVCVCVCVLCVCCVCVCSII